MNKRIYTGFSLLNFLTIFALRLVLLCAAFYAVFHYNENPIVSIFVILICLLFIWIVGDERIVIYKDRIVKTTNSLSALYLNSKQTTYNIKDIEEVYLQPPPSNTESGAALFLLTVLPKNATNSLPEYPIFLKLKNGETVRLETGLRYYELEKIVSIIHKLVSA